MVYRMIFNQTAYFGRGAIKEIPAVAKQHGFTKAFIVTDPVLLETGTAEKVTKVLDEAGLPYEVFSNVKPNPPVECIKDGVAKFAESGADFLIGLGGGSPQDTCKGIGIITANPEFADVLSLEGVADTKNPSVRSSACRPPPAPPRRRPSTTWSPTRPTSASSWLSTRTTSRSSLSWTRI
mgnify:CR=1 FL=1